MAHNPLFKIGYNYYGNFLRKSLCLTSFFRKPQYGVIEWEELSRSSSFLIRSNIAKKKFHIISAAHVTHPFLFPNLYPRQYEDFLKFLDESDTKKVLQLREFETGKVLEEFPLINHSWNNIDKDLVITHLEDEEFVINLLKRKYDIQIEPLELMDFDSSLSQGQKVSIIGHDYVQNNGHELLIPASLDGEIVSKTDNGRYILKTTRPSEMGLCGGPVLIKNTENKCVGMVEARINIKSKIKEIEHIDDSTLVVRSEEIIKYIKEIEDSM